MLKLTTPIKEPISTLTLKQSTGLPLMKIELLEINDGQGCDYSNSWFNIDGETYGLSQGQGGAEDVSLLDCEGRPIEECNDFDGYKNALLAYVERNGIQLI